MSNQVHLVITAHNADGLALALRHAHGRYAIYWNAVHQSSVHAWQGRYHSCPLDRVHLWEALRYMELNPVRAGLASEAEMWRWSSAAAHCGAEVGNEILDLEVWQKLDCQCWASVPSGRRDGIQADGDSSVHPHRAAAG